MDGKGRALDNMFIERFWRVLKQEDLHLIIVYGLHDFKLIVSFDKVPP
ncbi:transposase [Pedobacter sp. KBW06]|nr:transposase [Pedobacter sp. KBW06]